MSEHAQLCDLIADLINEQRNTTAAVVKLTEAIANAGNKTAKVETTKAIETAQTAAKYTEQKAIKAEPPVADPAAPAQAQPAAAPAEAPKTDVTYDAAKAAVLKVNEVKGREATVALLAKFGVSKLPELPAEKWAAVISACDEVLA